ncbi:SDR family oxidoreductase [Asanoa sp. WMMD1127]|uniref:SDR family oxidoreductase n=1 Tax=Asanoa sp. WMMD1127 TaxID=3016107 RepID=UPI002415B9F7|nr:SDR family oxidoreductase [Asanoa sp. WMMD1127]MDG4820356.1 SDR family oxidoreductase [Asanoa sp. WMMD1127]
MSATPAREAGRSQAPGPGVLAVTGSTGELGRRVAQRLADAGQPQRLVVRSPDRAPTLPGATVAAADYADAAAAERALSGVDTLFMVSGAEEADRVTKHLTFIDAAVAAGVKHLVYTSFLGAAPDSTFTLARHHYATEQHLHASGISHTILRDNLYLDFLPMLAVDGVIRGPAGEGRVAGVARDDVADVAVAVLGEPGRHAGQVYDLTGPFALTLEEAAATMTAILNRPYRYEEETVEQAYAARAHYGAPAWQVDGWVSTYTAIAHGDLAEVTDTVERVAGHPPVDFAEVLRRANPVAEA